jgi:biotin operon repressor
MLCQKAAGDLADDMRLTVCDFRLFAYVVGTCNRDCVVKLNQSLVAESLRISRTSVVKALRNLVKCGYLENPERGCYKIPKNVALRRPPKSEKHDKRPNQP